MVNLARHNDWHWDAITGAEIAGDYKPQPIVYQTAAAALEELTSQPGFSRTFLPHGRAPNVGERFVFPEAARALRLIAETRGEAYYRGEIAECTTANIVSAGNATIGRESRVGLVQYSGTYSYRDNAQIGEARKMEPGA